VLAVVAASEHVLAGNSLLILLAITIPAALLATQRALPLAIYAAAWFAFSLLRAGANDLGIPDQGAHIAAIDRWLGFGLTPTERLQNAFYRPGQTGPLDLLAIWTHTSYYLAPHLVAIALWWRGVRSGDSSAFDRYLRATLGLMLAGLILYVAVPTAPPWLQATREDPMRVYRITSVSNIEAEQDPDQVYTFFTDPNPIAAMPSLHEGFTMLMALILYGLNRRLGLLALLYAAAMGFALVYLGEHYLVDVLVGAVLAVGVVWWTGRGMRGPT
jgi:membrane-associated phospholipid phosphatase